MRDGSTSTARQLMPAIVAASGCAPPIPPSPAVRTQKGPSRWVRFATARRAATNVSYVPCRMPCVPM